jgi:putative ATP-binding cassette transporter
LKKLLDQIDNWSQRLSPGEQQRLAFVRALLIRPAALFLDEASSALDTETEDHVYQLILQELPEAAIVSVAHRESVAKHHPIRWQFVPDRRAVMQGENEPERWQYTIQCAKTAK